MAKSLIRAFSFCYTYSMNQYKAIIFDYGGVIHGVPNAKGIGIFEAICDNLDINIEEFKALYFANNYRNNLENWTHAETLLYIVNKLAPGKSQEAEKIIVDFLQRRTLNQELLEHIQKLKDQGYVVALLSNYNSELRNRVAENGVGQLFGENIFISTEIGAQKPDPKIFAHTFEKLGVAPEEVIFIDDSSMSLSTAESIGYHPIRFIDNEQLVADLQALGISL